MRSLVFELSTRLSRRSSKRTRRLVSAALIAAVVIFGRQVPRLTGLLGFYPSELNFGDQQLSVRSAIQKFTVVNLGNTPTYVRMAIVVGQIDAFTKKEDTCSGVSLAVHDSCTIGIEFLPKKGESYKADLLLTTGFEMHYTAPLLGDGTQLETIGIAPHNLNFPDQEVGSQSSPSPITITNLRNIGLTLKRDAAYDPEGEFRLDGDCLKPVQPNQTICSIDVRFAPKSAGKRQRFLVIRETSKGANSASFILNVTDKAQGDREGQHVIPMKGNGTQATKVDLTVVTDGKGTVISTQPGIDCPVKCTATFTEGSSVELRATPGDRWKFAAWSEPTCGSESPVCTVAVHPGGGITATFKETTIPRTLIVRMLYLTNPGCRNTFDGTVASKPTGLACEVMSQPPRAAMVASVPIARSKLAALEARIVLKQINELKRCVAEFASGEKVVLSADSNASSKFIEFNGDCKSTSKTCELVMDSNKEVTATFCAPSVI